jgi:hypothetical protein
MRENQNTLPGLKRRNLTTCELFCVVEQGGEWKILRYLSLMFALKQLDGVCS